VDFTRAQRLPKSHACFFFATTRLLRFRNEGHAFLDRILTLSNPIFLPAAYSPALICFGL
jgi:hypothetical protein